MLEKLEYLAESLGRILNIRNDIKDEGFTSLDGTIITLREDVYDLLLENDPRARFTAIHELAHRILHCNNTSNMVRCRTEEIQSYCDPEWQANALAGALLCPANMIKNMNCEEIMKKFRVSKECAIRRLNIIARYF